MIAFRCEKINQPNPKDDSRHYVVTMNNQAIAGSYFGCVKSLCYSYANGQDIYNYDGLYIGNNITNYANMFYQCHQFNPNYTLNLSNATNLYNVFAESESFNAPIIFPTFVNSMVGAFNNCTNFNQPVNLPSSKNYKSAFDGCENFNQQINTDNLSITTYGQYDRIDFSYMLNGCESFNQPFTLKPNFYFDNAVPCYNVNTNYYSMFGWCNNLKHPINLYNVYNGRYLFQHCGNIIGNISLYLQDNLRNSSLIDLMWMFYHCDNIKSNIYIEGTSTNSGVVADLRSMFNYCMGFNSNITFNVSHNCILGSIFNNCQEFNQSVSFPHVTNYGSEFDFSNMFSYCLIFNKPISFADGKIDSKYNSHYVNMFGTCFFFNQPVLSSSPLIPYTNNVNNMSYMFLNCFRYNQTTYTFPSNIEYPCIGMFKNCVNLSSPIYFSNKVNKLNEAFNGCTNFSSDIYINGTSYRQIGIIGMMDRMSNAKRKNLHFNSTLNNVFNVSSSISLIGKSITWSTMTNGFYNATYNIYCYNNYSMA